MWSGRGVFWPFVGALLFNVPARSMQFFVGGSASYHVASARISGTNPLKMFSDRNKLIFENVVDNFYERNPDVKQEENYYIKRFEALNPEITLLDKLLQGGGLILWAGVGRRTEKRFYYGCEIDLSYKGLSADIKDEQRIVFSESGEGVLYLRNLISGTVTSSSTVAFSKHWEAALKLRLGFFSTDRFLGFVSCGVSVHCNIFDSCRVDIKPQMNLTHLNDEYSNSSSALIKWNSTWVKSLTDQQYFVTTGQHCFASLNIGLGCDYFVRPKVFVRLEYQYKFAFANHLRFSHYTDVTEDSYKAYAIRYQDGEHCLSLGLGRTLP